MSIKYAYTIFYVDDVESTIAFYMSAFGLEQKMLTPEKDYGELSTGSTVIAFATVELANSNFRRPFTVSTPDANPFGVEIAFTVEDVDQVMSRAVDVGAVLWEAPCTKPWGQKVGYLRDPNGFIIEICTSMG